jgi:Phospholipid methyltransferase
MSSEAKPLSFDGLFWSKTAYKKIADDFHPFHRHDVNALLHFWTTGLGIWGAVALAKHFDLSMIVHGYTLLVLLTTPFHTAAIHTAIIGLFLFAPIFSLDTVSSMLPYHVDNLYISIAAIALGYCLQDLLHIIFCEKTYMSTYITSNPLMLLVHSVYLMPLVIDCVVMRNCFLPWIVTRNRNIWIQVSNKDSIDSLRKWIHENVRETPVTTHIWPHKQEVTSVHVKKLEDDASIFAAFREVFASKHFDIKPIQGMNEIYITAVGAKKEITSDAVFYTPHVDGPYWWTPFASCYRILIGVTPNRMVRTRFNLQHESQDKVLSMYDSLGFDYNRELHWIDHVPETSNDERRSVIKLHFVIYPKGWHWYGNLVAMLNENYNTWARGNFLRTLTPSGAYELVLAWWIWLTTWTNALFVEYVGWDNLVYIAASYLAGPHPFLILTSFRHYFVYVTTFAFREKPVAHGYLMRDAKLYKTMALSHLGRRILPSINIYHDWPGVILAAIGFSITMLATARLGFVRTYFGSELGFVKPKWIEGFPYGYIPHPMIVGQLLAYSSILMWFNLNLETEVLISTHMLFYSFHMVQEMLTSSY